MPRGKPYPKDFKALAAQRVQNGEAPKDVALDIGVHLSLIHKWAREFAPTGDDVPPALIETLASEISEPEPEGLIIPDSKNRIMLIPALIESGYSVRMEDGRVYYD